MTKVAERNKRIAKFVAGIFRGECSVRRYKDKGELNYIDILTSRNSPEPGLSSFSTIGLSSYPLLNDGQEYKTRVEFIGAATNNSIGFENVLATAAFSVSISEWFCYPGSIFPDILSSNKISSTMTSVLFESPFLWEDSLKTITDEEIQIAWLMAIPISAKEERFAIEHGSDALSDLLEEKETDIFDLERHSVV